MPNRAKTTLRLPIYEEQFYDCRRWLKSRDPSAELKYEPADDGLWLLTLRVTKRYLAEAAVRKWGAR
jgi:hypothetical protein